MLHLKLRPSLLIVLAAWLSIIVFAGYLLVSAQFSRWERNFDDDVQLMAGEIRQKLDANEAVLAGFSAFLHAVDRSDTDSAMRYAASAASAYPHIYIFEVARKVAPSEQKALERSLREGWLPDFSIKTFPELTGRPLREEARETAIWPILFMYPSLADAKSIYGVRLETVDYLAQTVALAHNNVRPVVSPVFTLYEGGSAYILLQEVTRAIQTTSPALNFFGDTMIALLVIKAQSLLPSQMELSDHENIGFSAWLASAANPESLLFERKAIQPGAVDQNFLPEYTQRVKINSASQPMLIQFQRQLRWRELLSPDALTSVSLLIAAMLVVPWLTLRHYRSLDKAERQHKRAAYLATHDMLTDLPNRFLFADRFEQAWKSWQRNGSPFALLLVDLDHFKEINDRQGHEVGDQVLIACGQRMVRELRACDTVARLGGDEFIILLALIQHADDARSVGEKLLAAINLPIETTAGSQHVSCSIGVSICPLHGESLDVLRRSADRAMYQAKNAGRSTVAVFSSEIPETTVNTTLTSQ